MRSDAKTSRVFFGRGGKLLCKLGTGANRAQHRYVAQTKQTVFREHRRSYKRRMLCREEKTQSGKLRIMKYFPNVVRSVFRRRFAIARTIFPHIRFNTGDGIFFYKMPRRR